MSIARCCAITCLGMAVSALGSCTSKRSMLISDKGSGDGRDPAMSAQAMAQPKVPGCPYISAPENSLVVEGNHHVPKLVYWPRSVPKTYSGCAYFWLGSRLNSIARFENGAVVDGVIDNLVEGVWDDSDLPPMVYCKVRDEPSEGDCGRFAETWDSWIEQLPEIVNASKKRNKY